MSPAPGRPLVLAAGAVLHRSGPAGAEVLLVHRPRYDDWSLPKGKLDDGESYEDAAVREAREETGYRVRLGRELATVRYTDQKDRPKTVRYWAMTVEAGDFTPNDEVDELRWLRPRKAADLFTYRRDRDVLDAFLATRKH